MVKENYQAEISGTNVARAMFTNKRISTKYATELCREIRGKPVDKAIAFVKRIIAHEDFLPLRKYRLKVAHRKGNARTVPSGRFPEKVCNAFVELLESVKSNAANKGLNEDALIIRHVFASGGFHRKAMQSRGKIAGKVRKRKSTHLEVIVQESKGVKK